MIIHVCEMSRSLHRVQGIGPLVSRASFHVQIAKTTKDNPYYYFARKRCVSAGVNLSACIKNKDVKTIDTVLVKE